MANTTFVIASIAARKTLNWKEQKFLPFELHRTKGKVSGPNTSFKTGVYEVPADSTVVEIGGDWIKSPKDFYYAAYAASLSATNKAIPDYVVDYILNNNGNLDGCRLIDPKSIKIEKPKTEPKAQLSLTKTVTKSQKNPWIPKQALAEVVPSTEVDVLKAEIAELKALVESMAQKQVVPQPEPPKPKAKRTRRSSEEVATAKAVEAVEKAEAAAAKAAEAVSKVATKVAIVEDELLEEADVEPPKMVSIKMAKPFDVTPFVAMPPEIPSAPLKPQIEMEVFDKHLSEFRGAKTTFKPTVSKNWGDGELTEGQKLHVATYRSEQARIASEVAKPRNEFQTMELQLKLLADRQAKIEAMLHEAKRQKAALNSLSNVTLVTLEEDGGDDDLAF